MGSLNKDTGQFLDTHIARRMSHADLQSRPLNVCSSVDSVANPKP